MYTYHYNKISQTIIDEFEKALGSERLLRTKEALEKYGRDETEDLHFLPELVIRPETVEQVSSVLKICSEEKVPVTTRGAGTGLSGAALPVKGGVLLSMEKFNKILEIDERNLQATIEPGVINYVFRRK